MLNYKNKPVIAMLHLKGSDSRDRAERMKRELDIYIKRGIDGVMVQDYFGTAEDCRAALEYLKTNIPDFCYGINIRKDNRLTFELAEEYSAHFIQIGSVSGHLAPDEDRAFGEELNSLRKNSSFDVLGGVRFKYQPILSGRSTEEDLKVGMTRCDAVCTTGGGTGMDCPTEKLIEFKGYMGGFPLIAAAGVTGDNVNEKLKYADGAIVGSWFKEGHSAENEVCDEYVKQFAEQMRILREG
ncbi:MAG: membrane biogenesis protein [Clostridiales bacterium]|nr:membrane biogenesis protein [Clostridiales bacterium]